MLTRNNDEAKSSYMLSTDTIFLLILLIHGYTGLTVLKIKKKKSIWKLKIG